MPGRFQGHTRGDAASLVKQQLEQKGLYHGSQEVNEEVLMTKFGDIPYYRDRKDIKKEEDPVNLRKPALIVSLPKPSDIVSADKSGINVSMSSNLVFEANDNKMVGMTGGRTGCFCTACRATEKDMHGERVKEPYYMDMGAEEVWRHFNQLRDDMGETQDRETDVVIPSARGDYARRLGTKHAPLTDQIEFAKVIFSFLFQLLFELNPTISLDPVGSARLQAPAI